MIAVDGNAIGGALYEAYGHEMTAAMGVCRFCGASAHVAELVVYETAAGSVARCPRCGSVLIVAVVRRGETLVDASGLASLQPTP
jgi:DNA-directed RNA polymerase subunit RPC12/RpoP